MVYGVAVGLEKVIVFLVLPIMAKRLSVEEYGVWTQLIATASLLSLLIAMGFPSATVQILGGWSDPQQCANSFNSILVTISAAGLVCAAALLAVAPEVSSAVFGSPAYAVYAGLLGALVFTEAVYVQLLAIFEARRELLRFSIWNMVRNGGRYGVLCFAILLFGWSLQPAVTAMIIVQAVAAVAVYFIYVFPIARTRCRLSDAPWKRLCSFGFPLAVTGLLTWLGSVLNRFFLLHFLNLKEVSVFALSYTLGNITGVCWAILCGTVYPHLTSSWQAGDRARASRIISSSVEYFLFFVLPAIALLTLLDRPIIRLVARSEYVTGPPLLGLVSVGAALFGVYQLNVYGVLLAENSKLVLWIAAVWAAVTVVLNLALIPVLGLLGAPLASVIANAGLAIVGVKKCRQVVAYRIPWRGAFACVLASGLMCGLVALERCFWSGESMLHTLVFLGTGCLVYAAIDLLRPDSVLVRLGVRL